MRRAFSQPKPKTPFAETKTNKTLKTTFPRERIWRALSSAQDTMVRPPPPRRRDARGAGLD